MDQQQKLVLPAGMKMERLIVWRSPDGRTDWKIIPPTEVPEWLKVPEVMGALVAGDIAKNEAVSPWWYRAEKVPSEKEVRRLFGNTQRHAKIAARKRRRSAH